jgi:hypothetical protein
MDQASEAEVHPSFFEFIEREKTGLSPDRFPFQKGVIVAGKGLLRAAGHLPGRKRPSGWVEAGDGFGPRVNDKGKLWVKKLGQYWFIKRYRDVDGTILEYLALAFDQVPLCTKTEQEAMRLADYCHPNPGQTHLRFLVP